MSKVELLNNVAHQDLKVITRKGREFGDAVAGAVVYPFEIGALHKEYPVVFQKNSETNEFETIALFGFETGENLFLNEDGWKANYVPAVFRREPFMIGFQQSPGSAEPTMVVHVDMTNPRISQSDEGQKVFLESGGNSDYLEGVRQLLVQIHEGVSLNKEMMASLLSMDLIESFTVDVSFSNGASFKTDMFYTINKEKLFELDGEAVVKMHKSGLLQVAYMIIDSLSNIQTLVTKKEQALAKQG